MRIMFILGMLALVACRHPSATGVRLRVDSLIDEDRKASLITPDSVYRVVLDSIGEASVSVATENADGYAGFRYHGATVPLYIEKGKEFCVSLKIEDWIPKARFTGVGAKVNEYLNREALLGFYPDYTLSEKEFLEALEEQERTLLADLDRMHFDASFTRSERERIHYLVYAYLPGYPAYRIYRQGDRAYVPTEEFYARQRKAIPEVPELLGMPEYQETLIRLVDASGLSGNGDEWKCLENQLAYIGKNFRNPVIREFLVDRYATRYVARHANDHLEEIVRFYRANVAEPVKRQKFEELCGQWLKLVKGQPAPAFECRDPDGEIVHLYDFRGRYVYIDVWATWCRPCRDELPRFEQLASKFKDKNIAFISLSCDRDRTAWEKMVKGKKSEGIQLHADRNFSREYVVRSIPRFILIDPQGRIVSADMSRPSDWQTAIVLEELLGK